MNSSVFSANRSSSSPTVTFAASYSASSVCSDCRVPPRRASPSTNTSPSFDAHDGPGPDPLHHFVADAVDQRDARGGNQQRPDVGVAPGNRTRGIDDRGRPGFHKTLGGDAVEVFVVDDRDLTRAAGEASSPSCAGRPAPIPVTTGSRDALRAFIRHASSGLPRAAPWRACALRRCPRRRQASATTRRHDPRRPAARPARRRDRPRPP